MIPVLSAKVNDYEGGAVRARFSIFEDSVEIVTKADGSLAASNSWSIFDPQIALKPGSNYRVDVWAYDESAESLDPVSFYWSADADGIASSVTDLPTNCDDEFGPVVTPPTPSPSASPSPAPSPSWIPECVESDA